MFERHTSGSEMGEARVAQAGLATGGTERTAGLRQKRSHYRRLEVTTSEGTFDLEYRARGMGDERLLVDGQVVDRCRSTWWYAPCFRFRAGSAEGQLLVRHWPWLGLRSLKLIVDGQVLYTEGATEATVTPDELAGLMSERLVSGGIQVVGEPAAVVSPHRNIQCERQGSGVTLRQRWFSWLSVVMITICAAYDALLVAAFGYALAQAAPLWVYLLLLPFVLVGLVLTYSAVARLVNRTEIVLTPDRLAIRHKPLPWMGDRQIPVSNVKQLLCRESTLHNFEGDAWVTYTLAVRLEDGREVDLLSKIGAAETAHYLEKEVQGWLGAGSRATAGDQPV